MARPDTPDTGRGAMQKSLFADEWPGAGEPPPRAGLMVDRIRPPVKAHGGKYYLASACRKIRLARIFPATFGKNLREDGNLSQPGV